MNHRWVRITVGTIIGLCLGWSMAGLAEPWLPGSPSAWAEKAPHAAPHATGDSTKADGNSHGTDKALTAAKMLIPTPGGNPAVPDWYPHMLLWVVVLFVFALGYGLLNGRSPADAAIEAEQKARAQEAEDQGEHASDAH
jgi:hypothetical protein